jgi:transposase InsO family protein
LLTDIQFTAPGTGGLAVPLIWQVMANGEKFRAHAFEHACAGNDIKHHTTKARHPWNNGQVESTNRTFNNATVERLYYKSHDQLRQHLANSVVASDFARRLKTLKGLKPCEFICKTWVPWPDRFTLNLLQQMS